MKFILLFIFIYIFKINIKKEKTPIFYVTLWWLGWQMLSNFNSKFEISFITNCIFLVLILSFYLFSSFLLKLKQKKEIEREKIVNFPILKIISRIIGVIFLVINIVVLYKIMFYLKINGISFSIYRELLFRDNDINNVIIGEIYRKLFFYSVLYFLFYLSWGIYELKKGKVLAYLFSIFNLGIIDFINGSRSYLFLTIVLTLMFVFILRLSIKKLFLPISLIAISLVIISFLRNSMNLIKIIKVNLIYYHIISFKMFDKELMDINSFLNTTESTHGAATFGLIAIVISKFLGNTDLINYLIETQDKFVKQYLVFYDIGKEEAFFTNSFYTSFYNFYIDGGITLCILVVLIYGFVLSSNWKKYKKNTDYQSFLGVYLFVVLGITAIYVPSQYTQYFNMLIIYFIYKILKVFFNIIIARRKKEK